MRAVDPAVFADTERPLQANILRRSTDLHINVAGLNFPVHLPIKEGSLTGMYSKPDALCLSRLQGNAAKSRQLFYRSRHAGKAIPQVQLYNFIPRALTRIADRTADLNGFFRLDSFRRQGKI